MKPRIAVPLGVAGILAAIGTTIANANGLFTGHPSLAYWFWGASLALIAIAIAGWLLGRDNSRPFTTVSILDKPSRDKLRQSTIFVLEVEGTLALDNPDTNWKFLLTNCTTRILRSVQLDTVRSEIGAYDLCFNEIPVMTAGQKITVAHKIYPRRDAEKYGGKKATLWDFGTDHANVRGNTYIWYDIHIHYRDQEDDSIRDGGFVAVCFDLSEKIVKTEGAEYYRRERERWNRLSDF